MQKQESKLIRRDILLLFLGGMCAALISLSLQTVPGYMDADYYFVTGQYLAQGKGFSEPFLWNYLDNPEQLPHDSHLYWMPLTSLIAAAGMMLAGAQTFVGGRLLFLIFQALLPAATAWLAFQLLGDWKNARFAGSLALFSGFYFPYLGITDAFSPTMLLAIVFFGVFISKNSLIVRFQPIILGLIAGAMHLARADGILWLAAGMFVVIYQGIKRSARLGRIGFYLGILLLGYTAIMLPWYLRNLELFGTLFVSGSNKTLWLLSYEDTFMYPATRLTSTRWLASGWKSILSVRVDALFGNLKTYLGVQCSVILMPFLAAGWWHLRKNSVIILSSVVWLMFFLAMSLAFPFAGVRGGFFHSAAALQPVLWILSCVGFDVLITAGAKWRKWSLSQAKSVFSTALVVILFGITSFVVYQKILAPSPDGVPAWNIESKLYQQAESVLQEAGVEEDAIVMVNNPPTYTSATRRSAIVVPSAEVSDLLNLAEKFQAKILILERAHVRSLDWLYQNPTGNACCRLIGEVGDAYIFKLQGTQQE